MLTKEEIEKFITKYGEQHRKWVEDSLNWIRTQPQFEINTKLAELRFLFGLKKRARPKLHREKL